MANEGTLAGDAHATRDDLAASHGALDRPERHDAWVVSRGSIDVPPRVQTGRFLPAIMSLEGDGMTSTASDAYSVADRDAAIDFMADWPDYGEQRWYSDALNTQQVSFSWRRMPPGTGGRGSYGHRHPGQEEVYFVISGVATFKIGDDVFEAGPQTAVRVAGDAFRSVHNDTTDEAQLLIFSRRLAEPPTEKLDGFWPST